MPPRTTNRRITDEPAFVLHSHPWSESSLILEVFTRHQGRVVLVAKGAKKPTSNFRPLLLPLQPLQLTYTMPVAEGSAGAQAIYPIKGVQWSGGHTLPTGEALWAGLYVNELLMRLLAREDPHSALFDLYAGIVRVLAGVQESVALEPALRAFEVLLLYELGLLPQLNCHTTTQRPLQPHTHYTLTPHAGLGLASATTIPMHAALTGAQWIALQHALDIQPCHTHHIFSAVLQWCAPLIAQLKPQLRHVLQHYCGPPLLYTRQFMMELHSI